MKIEPKRLIKELENSTVYNYTVEKAYVDIIKENIKDAFGCYIKDDDIIVNDCIEVSLDLTESNINHKYGSIWYYNGINIFESFNYGLRMTDIKDNIITMAHIAPYSNGFISFIRDLLQMHYYANGTYYNDYKEVMKVIDDVMTKEEQYSHSGIFDFGFFKVRLYKNNKVTITFTDSESARLFYNVVHNLKAIKDNSKRF